MTLRWLFCAGPVHAVSGPYPAGLLVLPSAKGSDVDVVQQRALQAFRQ